ncbi:LOW QUALITY PROTEIN: hypothetical protein PHMEG_00028083 [Phytophthora megakarya]|uniref:Uncharacterized protein n=1 Tax=Phytophthora megakarya TaxID=4795 RepID=A0A225V705_9STRA|nr:LOW QUALITY PROTEIN: hypothetical protein PHMEG_00028083 [Phytophthora megakarya]
MYDENTFGEERAATSATSGAETSHTLAHVAQLVDEWRNQQTQPKRPRLKGVLVDDGGKYLHDRVQLLCM